ncbi:hypothetical protein GCM10020220_062420 [Nonomuraea rubra]|uniref:ankyrin repeat domain-containing protein n=1 Tax=Nonomuraea rubra TaxID=46180 RepID=UPI0031F0CBAA
MTALHWAAANDRLAVARALLARGAGPDLRDSAGNTPLSRAAERGATAMVRALLDHGATAGGTPPRPSPGATPATTSRPRYARGPGSTRRRARGSACGARRAEGGGVRVVAEVRDAEGRLRSEIHLGTRACRDRASPGARLGGDPGMSAGA